MALVNQNLATAQNPAPKQGNANYVLYALAQQQSTANLSCNSSSAPLPAATSTTPTAATGDASLIAVPVPGSSSGIGPYTLVSGVASGTTTVLPGGTQYIERKRHNPIRVRFC
jgi:hypothetical protein